jgi:hypothetical protein
MGGTAARVRFGVDLTSGIDALAPILTLVMLDEVCDRCWSKLMDCGVMIKRTQGNSTQEIYLGELGNSCRPHVTVRQLG